MIEKSEYTVLQFVEQGQYSHKVHLTVTGQSVMEYAKEEVKLDKEKIVGLIQSLAVQLREYYKCEEQQAYGYVNPYAIIVTDEEEIRLVDVDAEENKELCAKMQKRKVRQLFVRPEYVLSQKKRREDDLYGFGKCVQFLIEKCCVKPSLSLREKAVFQRIYLKCESGEKADTATWQQFFVRLQKVRKKEKIKKRKKVSWLLCLILFLLGWKIGQGKAVIRTEEQEENQSVNVQMEEQLHSLEAEVQQTKETLDLEKKYSSCLEFCQRSSLSDAQRESLENDFEEVSRKKEEQMNNREGKLFTARVYEKLYRYEAAIAIYEELKDISVDANEKKEIYRKLIELYETMDMPEKVIELSEVAIEEYPELMDDEKISMYYVSDIEEK